MPIHDWPEDERPRERLLKFGPQALSEAELLAVFFRTGTPGKSAVDLAREVIAHFASLRDMFAASPDQFQTIKGMGPAKSTQLQAILELARRAMSEELTQGVSLNSSRRVKDYLLLRLSHLPHEVFLVLFLDPQHRLIAAEELFRGTLTQASVHPREVIKCALARNAASVILAHNHPSGKPQPSQADRSLTDRLKQGLDLIDIDTLDHLIVAGHEVLSFRECGLL